jgi:prepilin peptidase CpaA
MIAQFLLLIVLPGLLAASAVWDLASFTIPNYLSLALAAAFIPFAITLGISPASLGMHLLAGLVALIIGFTMFARNYIGGGDAKLFAGMAMWLGPHDLLAYTLIATILGGVLTLTILGLRQLPLPADLARQSWIVRLHNATSGIPYGVALASGGFFVLPHAEILHLAAIS